jgi:hypothetical protein
VHQEEGRLVVNTSLCDISLTATLRSRAVLGLMAELAIVVAGVVTIGLALIVALPPVPSRGQGALSFLRGRRERPLDEPKASPFFRSP